MMNIKTALIASIVAASFALTACGKKEEAPAAQEQVAASSAASEETVTSVEVSPEMIDAAPMPGDDSASGAAAQ